MEHDAAKSGPPGKGLSSAKREDIWALIIAAAVMIASLAAPDQIHTFFKQILYLF
jgi:hypothetical protein